MITGLPDIGARKSWDFLILTISASTVHVKHDQASAGHMNYLAGRRLTSVVIGLDKSGYQVNIFLISPRKHMLWVLIRSASLSRF